MNLWTLAGSKTQGSSHVRSGIVCQDAWEYQLSSDGQWAAIVVSDGAGSAARAEEGSSLVSEYLVQKLTELSVQFEHRVPGSWINDYVIEHILELRKILRKKANSDNINDFHATLVACLIGPNGGFTIHIGDGAVLSGSIVVPSENADSAEIRLSGFSKPENGEYSNETFFITEGDWIKHIRISPIGNVDWIILGTDGGCALCLEGEAEPKSEFLQNFIQGFISQPEEILSEYIHQNLASDLADRLSSDDKTIVVCMRDRVFSLEKKSLKFIPSNAKPPALTPSEQLPAEPTLPEVQPLPSEVKQAETRQESEVLVKANEEPRIASHSIRKILIYVVLAALFAGLLFIWLGLNIFDARKASMVMPRQTNKPGSEEGAIALTTNIQNQEKSASPSKESDNSDGRPIQADDRKIAEQHKLISNKSSEKGYESPDKSVTQNKNAKKSDQEKTNSNKSDSNTSPSKVAPDRSNLETKQSKKPIQKTDTKNTE